MNRYSFFGGRKKGRQVLIAGLCLAAIPTFAQTSIDTAKTDAFFRRHEIQVTADAKSFISKPTVYAGHYDLFISPSEVLLFMGDTLVEELLDLDGAITVSLRRARPHPIRHRFLASRPMGQRVLGRMIGPRPNALIINRGRGN